MHVVQHDACREDGAALGVFKSTKGGYQEVYQLLGAIPGLPPRDLLEACDYTTEGDASGDDGGGSGPGSGDDEAADDGDEAQEGEAKVGAFDGEPGRQQAPQESEQVDLFTIGNTAERK